MRHYSPNERIAITPAGKQALVELREAKQQQAEQEDTETKRVFTRLAGEEPAIAELLKPIQKPVEER